MDSYINQVRYWEGKLLSRMKPCLPLWDFLNCVFKPAISCAKECHMTLLQRFSVAQHYQWAFLVSGSPFLSGPPVQCFTMMMLLSLLLRLPNTACSLFCLCLCFFLLWKLPSPSFSCEDAYCFPNPRSVCFLSPCNKSLQIWRLNMMQLLFRFKEVGFRNWLILIFCFWALHRAEVKLLGYLKAEVWRRSALSVSEVD